ncbi:nucleoid-associated protein [Massilia sp. YIM B02769]|uniref:nucleoid-associated protein n=1 Tax=Massilia sp. YIM B02769 TaxID=3050129 RepID=UPI0025B6D8FD|nr:nucleoid-associated protein [Massilia sp. YIM B02769]MDN4059562.1 nucleoid-associated protein [Massilia sp. YIM B02769]
MNISQAKIRRFITHSVGNKLRDEGILISKEATELDENVGSIILRNYLGGIRNSEIFRFFHESDTNLNEIKVFAESIFDNDEGFNVTSEKIAKHLYSKSTHPSVPSGDLFIVLFSGVLIEEKEVDALGIFKTETKEDFLSVYEENGALLVRGSLGIDPRNLQKAAIIPKGHDFLYAFEKGSSTSYWLDEFLKVQKLPTKKSAASYVARLVKETVREIGEPQAVASYQQEINRVLADDAPTIQGLLDAGESFVGPEKAAKLRHMVDTATGLELEPNHVLEQKTTYRAAANVFKRVPIAKGIELLLSAQTSAKAIKSAFSSDRRFVTITIEMEGAK